MSDPQHDLNSSKRAREKQSLFDKKLTAYAAAIASGSLVATEAGAVVVSNSSPVSFGVDEFVDIDFNSDGQIDFQIDHDRVELGGGNVVDYLQLDKNDVSGASPGENPLAFPTTFFETFPENGTTANDPWESGYVIPTGGPGVAEYPAALLAGQEIGPTTSVFDFQEGDNAFSSGDIVRANRLIDEDHTQVDTILGGQTAEDFYPISNSPGFVGLGGQVRYLGVKMDLNDTNQFNYGWIGIKITDEDDATGDVVGWGYETDFGVSILAGEVGAPVDTPGDFNKDGTVDAADYVMWRKNNGPAGDYTTWQNNFGEGSPGAGGFAVAGADSASVPEPTSLLFAVVMGVTMICSFFRRRVRGA
jgi:hypothetical protein